MILTIFYPITIVCYVTSDILIMFSLYEEKMKKIESKLIDLKDETAPEYLKPVKVLNEKLERKLNVALIRKDLRLDLIKVCLESAVGGSYC